MKIRKLWPLYVLLIAVGLPGARLAWRLTTSELGWMPHLEQWANGAASIIGVERREFSNLDPAEQATFWLNEVERIGSANDDAEMAMGAAWMLDSPQFGFIRRHVSMKDDVGYPGLPASWRRELDHQTIAAMVEEFELLCRDECLGWIARAVRLDDANVELRRARALLLFQTRFISFDSEPRQDDWLSVLDECARVDPDNALYDYLAALHLWTSSADHDWEEGGYVLNIEDKDRFEDGNMRLAAGHGKPHLKFGTEVYAATFEFLKETSVSRSDYLKAVGSRQIDNRATSLLYLIMRWVSVQKDAEQRADRLDAAIGAVRSVLAISAQVSPTGNYANLLTPRLILRQWSLANLVNMHEDHPDLVSADEAAIASKQLAEVQLELKILEEVYGRMAPTVSDNLLSVMLMASAQMLVIVCIGIALMSALISLLFGRGGNSDQSTAGWLSHIGAWVVALGVSFIVLGMFPAEIVSASVQTWLVCGAIWVGFGAVYLGFLHLLRRRFKLPAGQVAGLVFVTSLPMIAVAQAANIMDLVVAGNARLLSVNSIALILFLAVTCWTSFHFLRKFVQNQNLTRRRKLLAVEVVFLIALVAVPAGTVLGMMTHEIETSAWISPTVWRAAQGLHFDAEELQIAMKMEEARWAWALIQWLSHHGPVVAPLMAVVIVMVCHLIRRAVRVEGGPRQILRSQKRCELRQSGKTIASSCVVAAVVFLALYLAATPPVVDMMDNYHRVHFARMTQPARAWEEIAERTVEVRADKETMSRLQSEIDDRNRRIAEQ